MTNKEKYKAVFSQVHTTAKIEMEDFKMMKSIRGNRKRVVVLVAAVCMVMACTVTAFAVNMFGLKDLVLKSDTNGIVTTDESAASEDNESPVAEDMISLQGFPDSNEYKAVAEWTAFKKSYDKDGTELDKVGNGPTGLDEKYALYSVYTQEMADQLDGIVSQYGLKLHKSIEVDLSMQDLINKAGIGDFMGDINTPESIYSYEDGTFHIDGTFNSNNTVISNDSTEVFSGQYFRYQLIHCKKGSFTESILNIGNQNDYNEWAYTTVKGIPVSLSISPSKSLVIVKLENSFITINVLAGSGKDSGEITASDFEKFADSFDFSALN